MNLSEALHQQLNPWHLLSHPFYQAWNAGILSKETLQIYAMEYYHHVSAFPRYISAIHSLCPNIKIRQILLGNLLEEEQGEENHPELWQRFAEGLGLLRDNLNDSPKLKATRDLVDGYLDLTRSDFATGLGALYAYECQTPAVAKSKIEGLKEHYGIEDERTLQFFSVHKETDEWHAADIANIINGLGKDDQDKAVQGAGRGAKLLWKFLDEMMTIHEC